MEFLEFYNPAKQSSIEQLEEIWEKLKESLDHKDMDSFALKLSLKPFNNFTKTIESSKKFKTARTSETSFKSYLEVLFELFTKLRKFSKTASLTTLEQQHILKGMLCYYIQEIVKGKLSFRMILRTFADILVKFSLNQPPTHFKYLNLEDIKMTMDFFVENIFWYHNLLNKVFGCKQMMNLRTFSIFRRKNPMSLGIENGVEIDQPLNIPFLRQYLLEEDEFYFNDEEVVKIFESGKLDKYKEEEREYIETRYKRMKREELVRMVMEKKIGELKEEIGEKVEELREIVGN